MSELQPTGEQSPFDAIRRVREDGSEYWTARDLQVATAYARWEDFAKIVDRAIASAQNSGHDVPRSFSAITEKPSGGGRPRSDHELSRFGAYLTVMNGDPNLPRVAEAQAYFAVKAREAEVAPPVVELTEDQIVHRALHILDSKVKELTVENRTLVAAIERDAPMVAKAEAHTVSDTAIHRQEFSREVKTWGKKQNITILQEEVMRFLGHIGLFIKGERSDTGHATAEAIRRGLAYTDKGVSKKNGHAYAVGKLTPLGQDFAWKRITQYVADNGTLRLPRELGRGDAS